MNTDIIVIGGGTAGMTAAIYALRNGKSVLLIESESVGGQIAFSPKVENFPSYRQISGADFANKTFEQVIDLGADFELEEVESIVKTPNGEFIVNTNCQTHTAKAVIIANGVKQKHIGIDAEARLLGKGVYYCAVCDGAFCKGAEAAIIGDGNTALQSAILLSQICTKVYIMTWFDKFFGDQSLVDTIKRTSNITVMPNTQVVDFIGQDALEGVEYIQKEEGKRAVLNVPAVFVNIGQVPDNKRFEGLVELDNDGYILAREDMSTKTEGLFAAGDTRKKALRQLTTAVSDGAVAAISAVNYLSK